MKNGGDGMEDKIYLVLYRFTLRAEEELDLPAYLGSTLRGGFGHVFRRICCPTRQRECKGCPLVPQCPYALIFETSPPPDSPALRNLEEIPRPFVISPPPASTLKYPPGSTFSFEVTLIGKAIAFLPYFIVAFKELGAVGLGRGRGHFSLKQIELLNPFNGNSIRIYSGEDEMVRPVDDKVTLKDCRELAPQKLPPLNSSLLTLSFLTPTRLKHQGHLVDRPDFHIVFRALLRRLSSLALFHCGTKLDLDYQGLIAKAQKVELIWNRTRWVEWERFSSRQKEKMFFGGILGEAAYAGDFTPFLPYLVFGQWTHVGKNCTFGLGRYKVKSEVN